MTATSKVPWLDYLSSHIGLEEVPGPEHNPLIVEWGQQSGIGWWNNDEDAWCAVAVNGALVDAGFPSTRSALARSFTRYGTRLARPVRGAIVVFPRGTNPLYGHVGIVDEVRADGTIVIVNGNVSNMVRRSTFRQGAILADGIRWPPGAPMTAEARAAVVGAVAAAGAEEPAGELGERILRLGDEGADVEALQGQLDAVGYMSNDPGVHRFGPDTEDAVRRFQKDMGLVRDGIAGPATLSTLARRIADKRQTDEAASTAKAAAKPAAATAGGLGAAGAAAAATAVSSAAKDVGGLWDGTALGLVFVALLVAAGLGYLAYRHFTARAAREAAT